MTVSSIVAPSLQEARRTQRPPSSLRPAPPSRYVELLGAADQLAGRNVQVVGFGDPQLHGQFAGGETSLPG